LAASGPPAEAQGAWRKAEGARVKVQGARAMPKIVDTPIEFRCPVCGKITKILGGEGSLGLPQINWRGGRNEKDFCHCGEKKAKK
jgi:hypothetical protein